MLSVKLHNSVKDFPPRGGSSICETTDYIIVFGGANREQTSYQDLIAYKKSSTTASTPFATYMSVKGDVPMPRSGHTLTSYGPYVFLFGGIDFSEEAVYNDIYILDTKAWEWHYVGEKGVEIPARNAHSTCVLRKADNDAVLVIFGGASPEHGPMGDAFYAFLPPVDTIDPASIYLDWRLLPSSPAQYPRPREMHGSCAFLQDMYVSGGRGVDGLLGDVWRLRYEGRSEEEEEKGLFVWIEEGLLSGGPRCAHTMCFLTPYNSPSPTHPLLCIYGGFTEGGVGGEFYVREDAVWTAPLLPSSPTAAPAARFGHTACSLSRHALTGLISHGLYGPLVRRAGIDLIDAPIDDANCPVGIMLFGGASVDMEFGDLWLCVYAPPKV
eukprot:gene33815-40916_t